MASRRKKQKQAKVPAISPSQLQEIREAFDLFDADNSGSISPQELKTALKALGLSKTSEDEVKEMISRADKDNDGAINFDEFVEMITAKMVSRTKALPSDNPQLTHLSYQESKDTIAEMKKAFKLFDWDNTGSITLENLRKVAQELGERLSDEELQEMIEEADSNGSGSVNQTEFLRIMKKAKMC